MLCYLDDCNFIATLADDLITDVNNAMHLFDSLGLTINTQKSVLEPTQEIEFLGVILNTVDMTATLTPRRTDIIKAQRLLQLKDHVTLHKLSSFIGITMASDPAMELGPLRYKYLEIVHSRALIQSHGSNDSYVILDSHAWDLINWWINDIDIQVKSFQSCPHQLAMYVDACLSGWAATLGDTRTGAYGGS